MILDIFAQHASSREGKAQVELAQLSYLLPRLRGWGVALSRQAGGRVAGGAGIGTRGPGETQLEVDRRKINRRMTKLRRDLRDFAKTRTPEDQGPRAPRACRRSRWSATPTPASPRCSTGSPAPTCYVADQLFATLDTTARQLELPDGRAGRRDRHRRVRQEAADAARRGLQVHARGHPARRPAAARRRRVARRGRGADPRRRPRARRHRRGRVQRLLVLNKADAADRDIARRAAARSGATRSPSPPSRARASSGLLERVAERCRRRGAWSRRWCPTTAPTSSRLAHRDGEVLKEEHRDEGTYLVASVDRAAGAALERAGALVGADPWAERDRDD